MAAYFNTDELKTAMTNLIKQYIDECEECQELSQDCIDLIRHNFLAEYAVYNPDNNSIEVGIDVSEDSSEYPELEVYTIPLTDAQIRISNSFRQNAEDLEFYGKLLNKQKGIQSSSIVVMQ
ncbi:MAG: hypothetical protein ABGW91_12680 [Christiangramia sp.]|nr:hypothetical protein [Christiangramia sp.]